MTTKELDMIIYVDIDHTICDNDNYLDYSSAQPWHDNIEKINQLYDDGHMIVYWTARGGSTGIDWTELTTQQLKEWGVKHHELKMWKPHYDLFICDKAINTEQYFKEK